ncbi:MAG TPA: AAA family ATPase [Pirellulales bacterium]|nr:AAA family ATPase [Pirellulales bacterium]
MRILSAQVDGFGVWSGLKLENLNDRIAVFYGPNEAGKTTLLQFVRTMLYGFSHDRAHRYLPPLRGGQPGGTLHVAAGAAGRFAISRHRIQKGGEHEELRIVAADGVLQPDYVLGGLLGGIDEATFKHVFALGLGEMQELGTLGDSAASEFLYQLSTGLNGVTLAEVLRELAASRERTVSSDKNACKLGDLLGRRETLQHDVDELRSQVHRQAAIAHELAELETTVAVCETDRENLELAARAVEAAVTVREPWRRRAELTREIAELPPVAAVSPGTLERLDVLNEALQGRRRRIAELVRARRTVRDEMRALDFNARLARHAPRIEALVEQATWLGTLETQVEQLTAEITSLEHQLAEHRRELGLNGKQTHDQGPARKAIVGRLRPAARGLAKSEARAKTAHDEQAASDRQAQKLAEQIRAALRDGSDHDLAPALERAGNLVAQLRRRVHLDERLGQLARHESELADQGRLLLDRQLLPAWVLVALGSVFVFGVVLVLANMFLPSSLVGTAGWMLATIGALGAIGAAGGKFLLDRSATNQLEACQKQAAILASQVKQAKEEREAIDAQLPRGGGPLLVRLQTAEKELAALEELLGVDSQRKAALAAAEAAAARVAAADRDSREARRRWEQALSSAGLSKNLTPKQARQFAGRHGKLAELARQHEERWSELQDRQRDLDALSGRIKQVFHDIEAHPSARRASEQLHELRQKLAAHEVVATKRAALEQRAARLRRQQTRLTTAVRRGEQRRQQLLHEAHAAGEADLRVRAAEHDRRLALVARRDALSRDIATGLAGRLSEDELRVWLEGPECERLEARWDELARQIDAATDRLHVLHEQRGRLEQEAISLADDRRMATRLVELGAVDQQVREAVERWRVLTVTECLLDSVRRTYESERQPEALKEASKHLARLTDGRYTRIWTPLGERALRVDDGEGNSLPVEVLSRGTREQLFLSLRLALVDVYGRRGVELPLVLDDVLVNFDARRAQAAATVLREFADAGHQVLVFTCHEHLAQLFRNLRVSVHALPANDDSGAITVAYPRKADSTEEPQGDRYEVAAAWQPEEDGGDVVEVIDEVPEEEPTAGAKPKRPRKGRRKKPRPAAEHRPAVDDDVEPGRPHRVSVVRGKPLQNPFADTSWHEPVDDDMDDAALVAEDEPLFEVDDRDETWPDDDGPRWSGSDDWHPGDDGHEAA